MLEPANQLKNLKRKLQQLFAISKQRETKVINFNLSRAAKAELPSMAN